MLLQKYYQNANSWQPVESSVPKRHRWTGLIDVVYTRIDLNIVDDASAFIN